MPVKSSDSFALLTISLLTCSIAVLITEIGSFPADTDIFSTIPLTVYFEAISPALCPPMPSATINKLGRQPILSSE